MNVMLAAGGYPWNVIPLEMRDDYMAALESASVQEDIEPFTIFLKHLVSDRLKVLLAQQSLFDVNMGIRVPLVSEPAAVPAGRPDSPGNAFLPIHQSRPG